jgi:hypothetical protein
LVRMHRERPLINAYTAPPPPPHTHTYTQSQPAKRVAKSIQHCLVHRCVF